MKNIAIVFIFTLYSFFSYAQTKDLGETNTLLIELAEIGCKCVDSINTVGKSKVKINKEISDCINKQTFAYQIGSKLMSVKDLEKTAVMVNGKKEINLNLNLNSDSEDYKNYYNQLEEHMLKTCKSLKEKIAVIDDVNEYAMSKDPKALKYYNKAMDVTKTENYKKAIKLYQKALKIDPTFVFAWDNLGICYRRLNDLDKAIEAYSKSLNINPKGQMPLQNIAVAYRFKKEFQNAIKAYENLAIVDKGNPEVYFGLAQVYAYDVKDYEKGLDNICKAFNIYIAQKSAYRSDAENIIKEIFVLMKKEGKENKFYEILKQNNISTKE